MTINTTEGRINANKATLNLLASLAGEASLRYEELGLNGLAAQADRIASEIHAALSDLGYYDF